MRIAVYHNLISGGNKRMLYETVRGMKANAHTVDVFTLSISNDAFFPLAGVADRFHTHPLVSSRVSARLHPGLRQVIHLPFVRRANRIIAETINNGGYDVVWVSNCWITQHPFVLRYLKRPHILYTAEHFRGAHDRIAAQALSEGAEPRPSPGILSAGVSAMVGILAAADYRNTRAATNILSNSGFTSENLLRYYGKLSKRVYPCIDTNTFRPGKTTKEELVLTVGGLHRFKGHDLVVHGVGRLPPARRPGVVIVGDRVENASEVDRLSRLAKVSGVKLEILENVSDAVLVELYNRAKVTVCASLLEPFGLVPLESMACATPVVAVREGGLRESVVDGLTGFLVDRNGAAVGDAVGRLLADEGGRSYMGQKGLEFVTRRFSIGFYWAEVERQLQSVARTNHLDYSGDSESS